MALTRTGGAVASINDCIGKLSTAFSFVIDSSVALTGQYIYFTAAFFESSQFEPIAITEAPAQGWRFQYPSTYTGQTITCEPIGENAFQYDIYRIDVQINTALQFQVNYQFFHVADLGGFPSGDQLENVDLLRKNAIGNPNNFDNNFSSVYESEKNIVLRTIHDDGTSNLPFDTLRHSFKARFWNTGIDGNPPETDNFSYFLTRGGNTVNNLSVFDDTKVEFSVSGTPDAAFTVGIFRVDNAANSRNFYDELKLNYGTVGVGGVVSAVDGTEIGAFVSGEQLTLVQGNTYKGSITLDKDYFEQNGRYHVYFIFYDGIKAYSPFITKEELVADDPQPPTIPDLTREFFTYNKDNEVYTTPCIGKLGPKERIHLRVSPDRSSYNDNVVTNGTSGTYLTNIDTTTFSILNEYPSEGEEIEELQNLPDDYTFQVNKNSSCDLKFRIPSDWADTSKWVAIIFKFTLRKGTPYQYSDFIYHLTKLEIGPALSAELSAQVLIPVGGPATRICLDRELVQVRITKTGALGDYDVIALIKETNETSYSEFEDFASTNLDQLQEAPITAVGAFGAGSTVDIDINPRLLKQDTEYCVTAIAKPFSFTQPPDPTCGNIDVSFTQTVTAANILSGQVSYQFDITSGILAADVASLQVTIREFPIFPASGEPLAGEPFIGTVSNSGALTISGSFQTGFEVNGATIITQYDVLITSTDGCVYVVRRVLQTQFLAAASTVEAVTGVTPN